MQTYHCRSCGHFHIADSPQTQTFSYDSLNRLTSASASGGAYGTYSTESYDYNDNNGNLTLKAGASYTYNPSVSCAAGSRSLPHAVASAGNTGYTYDCNGNMTRRDPQDPAVVYNFQYDAENRLVGASDSATASFSYDSDGQRVKGVVGGVTIAYVGNWFEWTGSTSTMKKYYYTGAQRIAMRSGSGTGTSGLQWIIGDHLGSTTKIANYDGTLISQRRYKPWGEWRFGGTMSTTFAFTGQRQEVQLGGSDGLYYYGARWYDAALGRWLSPDTIIPEAAQGVQAWSRYTYVNNAPTRYQDPTGHSADCAVGEPYPDGYDPTPPPPYKPTSTPRPPVQGPVWPLSAPPTPTPEYEIGPNTNPYYWGEVTMIDISKVDWVGLTINGLGLAGDVGLVSAVFGNAPGGVGWGISTVVEIVGIARDINDFLSENNSQGLMQDVFLEALDNSRWQRLIPVVGAAHNLAGIAEAIDPAINTVPVYGPPPMYAPRP